MKMLFIWLASGLLALYSLLLSFRSSFTTGTLMLWLSSAAFVVYGLFHKQIDAFTADGIGRMLKYLFFAGIAVYAALFAFVAISGYTNNAKGNEKAIIVLGAGLQGEEVSDVLRRRMQTALEAWQQNPEAIVVVTGGQGVQEVIPEAHAMQRWLLANGVPADKIIVEDKSTSTEENLQFALTLLQQAGIAPNEPVAVVSNAFHCYRAGRYATIVGFTNASTIPASMNLSTILPSYIREVLAILYLWVFKR